MKSIPLPQRPGAPGPLTWLGATARDWAGTEGERVIFVVKTMLAGFTALWLAYRLGLDSPGTSITTTFILALPSSGMVIEKAFYRLLGTLVGSASALTLIALFPQETVLLFAGLAVWVGLCTSGAAMFRNQQSYSFVLAGYTACIIVVPAIDFPTQVFPAAVARVTEVGLGIICSMVVSDALFPRHHSQQVLRTVQSRYSRFISFCQHVLEQKLAPADVELAQLQFAADIAALESGRAAAFFEAAHGRNQTRAVHAFNAAFMATLTTFYTLHRLLDRLRRDAASPVLAAVEPLYAKLGAVLDDDSTGDLLEATRLQLRAEVAAARQALAEAHLARAQSIDFETAVELLDRFALDMRVFQAVYHGLTVQKRQQYDDPQSYTPKTPPVIVLASGVRAATALAVLAGAWYYLAWPGAANAILMATVFCALASSSPRPNALVRAVLIGFVTALPLAFASEFFLLVHASGYPMLVLSMLPLVVLGTYLNTFPKTLGIGLGINLFAAQLLTPLNLLRIDGAAFLNTALGLIMGVALAYVIFAVLLPTLTMGHKGQVAKALWREARHACVAHTRGLRHRFGGRVRDLLSQLNAAAGPQPDQATRAVVRQALTLLELGHSVIELRVLIGESDASPARDALQHCVRRIAGYLRAPTPAACQDAVDAILQAGTAVRAVLPAAGPARALRLHAALVDLHSIYTSLLDQLTSPLPPAPEGNHRAA